jgi:hypothetical protein
MNWNNKVEKWTYQETVRTDSEYPMISEEDFHIITPKGKLTLSVNGIKKRSVRNGGICI